MLGTAESEAELNGTYRTSIQNQFVKKQTLTSGQNQSVDLIVVPANLLRHDAGCYE